MNTLELAAYVFQGDPTTSDLASTRRALRVLHGAERVSYLGVRIGGVLCWCSPERVPAVRARQRGEPVTLFKLLGKQPGWLSRLAVSAL